MTTLGTISDLFTFTNILLSIIAILLGLIYFRLPKPVKMAVLIKEE